MRLELMLDGDQAPSPASAGSAVARAVSPLPLPTIAKTRSQAGARRHESRFLRLVEASAAFLAILLAAPLFLLIMVLLKLEGAGPVFYGQRRIGRDGHPFRCLKFRTMAADADARLKHLLATDPAAAEEWRRTRKLRYDPRVTRVGAVLRRFSLDELPQLMNVLRGDMSFVGPRPIVEDEIVQYGRHFRDYCAVRPGLTGLWQVSGRNDVSYRRRVALDRSYVRSRSFRLDAAILARTIPTVLFGRGTY